MTRKKPLCVCGCPEKDHLKVRMSVLVGKNKPATPRATRKPPLTRDECRCGSCTDYLPDAVTLPEWIPDAV